MKPGIHNIGTRSRRLILSAAGLTIVWLIGVALAASGVKVVARSSTAPVSQAQYKAGRAGDMPGSVSQAFGPGGGGQAAAPGGQAAAPGAPGSQASATSKPLMSDEAFK